MSSEAGSGTKKTAEVHDARDGFHDIKPLYDVDSGGGIFIFLLLAAAAVLAWRYFARPRNLRPAKPRAPRDVIMELAALHDKVLRKEIAIKPAAEKVSEITRFYVTEVGKVSILENTPAEAGEKLMASSIAPYAQEISKLLYALEQISYREDDPAETPRVERLGAYIQNASGLLGKVHASARGEQT